MLVSLVIHRETMASNADIDTGSSTTGPDGDNGMSILRISPSLCKNNIESLRSTHARGRIAYGNN